MLYRRMCLPLTRTSTRHFASMSKNTTLFVDTDKVYCVGDTSNMLEAAYVMTQKNIGSLLIVNTETKECRGLITERDISRQIGRGVKDIKIVDFMTPAAKLFTATKGASSIEAIMKMMQSHNIRHIPLVEGNKVVEMRSIKNVMSRVKELMESDNNHLREYLEGSY